LYVRVGSSVSADFKEDGKISLDEIFGRFLQAVSKIWYEQRLITLT